MNPERVRFAPSPTGELHIGGVRTALYNWLIAKQTKGQFIIRLEDTDRARFVAGAGERLLKTLNWLKLTPDEGPLVGGKFGPYVQSERLDIYNKAALQLVEKGTAYWCFCTPERLAQMRAEQVSKKQAPRYDRLCLGLTPTQVQERRAAAKPGVIRHRVPDSGTTSFDDLVHGHVTFSHSDLDDYVLLKSDGYPTYHLAVVVDDCAMGITLVLRGDEWLPSTPKHLLLYKAFGWQAPRFGHLPHILDSSGAKLSKRHGAVSADDFWNMGILPEALLNGIALLGWNPGSEQEIFNLTELLDSFSLTKVHRSGAVFSLQKLLWLNQQHMARLSVGQLLSIVKPRLDDRLGIAWAQYPKQEALITLARERSQTLNELAENVSAVISLNRYDASLLIPKKGTRERTREALALALKAASNQQIPDSVNSIQAWLENVCAKHGFSRGEFFWPLRVALSGLAKSAGASELIASLPTEIVRERIRQAYVAIKLQ